MKTKLRDEARRALVLMLDRMPAASGNGGAVYAATQGASQARIARVQEILQVLDLMPAAEPPKDLVDRTMAFIESAPRDGRRTQPSIIPAIASQPPVA
jgi:hypothetical protein